MKRLYDSLGACAKEEEVKAEFCKFFKMKIFALRGIDHYTEHVLFEFKYDRNFRNPENVARALAQVMYYARMLKFGAGLTKYPLPPYICVVDKNEAFFAETKDYAKFYAAKGDRYDWDRAPSTPCPKLVGDILASFSLKGNNTNNFEKQLSGEARANSPAQAYSKTAAPVGAAEKEKVVFTSCSGCFQQIRNAIKSLRGKLLPQIYSLGFLNPPILQRASKVRQVWQGQASRSFSYQSIGTKNILSSFTIDPFRIPLNGFASR